MTKKEIELIDFMIGKQKHYAARCDNIKNPVVAERMREWDLKPVVLLEKIKAFHTQTPGEKGK
ncbi:MAG: hypothetical protein U9N86_09165 [Bacteroidota bacterium]|nr:hypothetical protein [Bacteroidota bacterium]